MERSVFEIVKAPLGWSVFADNVKIGGVYDSRAPPSKPPHWPRPTVSDGGGVQINVPGAEEEKPRWASRLTSRRYPADAERAATVKPVKAIARL